MASQSRRYERPTRLQDARSYAALALAGVSRRVLTRVASRWDSANADAYLRHAGINVDGLTRTR